MDLVSADWLFDYPKLGIGVIDPAFDKFGFVCNKGDGKFEFVGKDWNAQSCSRCLEDCGKLNSRMAQTSCHWHSPTLK